MTLLEIDGDTAIVKLTLGDLRELSETTHGLVCTDPNYHSYGYRFWEMFMRMRIIAFEDGGG